MKICAMSDLHGVLPQIQECDVVCICGDFSPIEFDRNTSKVEEWVNLEFFPWIRNLPCSKVILTPGNHDWITWVKQPEDIQKWIQDENLQDKFIYLVNSEYVYEDVRFFGCPYVSRLPHWPYYTWDGHEYKDIPENTDILLTHAAPSIGDVGLDMSIPRELGSIHLANVVRARSNIKYHFCGHIHDGSHRIHTIENTSIVNVSILDDNYELTYPEFYIDYVKN